MRIVLPILLLLIALPARGALEFGGSGVAEPTLDRVVIPLNATINLGGDFTIEAWLRMAPGDNTAPTPCSAGADAWIEGHVLIDRDVYGPGDFGDFGIALMQGRIAFGVHNGSTGSTACGSTDLRDGLWHHLAVTRHAGTGQLVIFVDGAADGTVTGPLGDLSYRLGRPTPWPWDAFLVLGAEKHDAGAEYPSFRGRLQDVRLSSGVRYSATFTAPLPPLQVDAATVALWRMNEGAGNRVGNAAASGDGTRRPTADCLPRWTRDAPGRMLLHGDGFEC